MRCGFFFFFWEGFGLRWLRSTIPRVFCSPFFLLLLLFFYSFWSWMQARGSAV